MILFINTSTCYRDHIQCRQFQGNEGSFDFYFSVHIGSLQELMTQLLRTQLQGRNWSRGRNQVKVKTNKEFWCFVLLSIFFLPIKYLFYVNYILTHFYFWFMWDWIGFFTKREENDAEKKPEPSSLPCKSDWQTTKWQWMEINVWKACFQKRWGESPNSWTLRFP